MSISVAGVSPLPASQPPLPIESRSDPAAAANNRAILAAVKVLADGGAVASGHEFSISIDPTTRQAIVKIVDLATKEVVEQLPSEMLLRMARQLSEGISQQLRQSTDKTLSL